MNAKQGLNYVFSDLKWLYGSREDMNVNFIDRLLQPELSQKATAWRLNKNNPHFNRKKPSSGTSKTEILPESDLYTLLLQEGWCYAWVALYFYDLHLSLCSF